MSTSTRQVRAGAARRAARQAGLGELRRALPRTSAALATRGATGRLCKVPPRHLGRDVAGHVATDEAWLRHRSPALADDLLLRYLGVFGPRTVADVTSCRASGVSAPCRATVTAAADVPRRAWSRAPRLPDAPRPDPDVPAPPGASSSVRQRPAALSHAVRGRFPTTASCAGRLGKRHRQLLHDGLPPAGSGADRDRDTTRSLFVHLRLDQRAVGDRGKASASCGSPPPT